ncbi:hypothetical protein [Bacillus atrophaeus]|uniref:hypothetical protein n=1 Tax=Bacillus atrophaeus TaxID=1452 RepID=UPI003872CC45
MKKKSWWIILLSIVIAASAAVAIYASSAEKGHIAVDKKDLKQKDFLDDKDALLYFSTAADQDTFGGGKSYALFAGQNGSLSSFKMRGLEQGSAGVKGESVMLEDKKTIFTIKNGLTAYDRTYQHTGDSAGYVGDQNGFYTLYNSGFDKEGNHYRSELYRQFNGKWKKDVIPYYIRASGFDGDSIYALIPTDDEKGYKILKIRADQKDLTYETIAEWTYKEGTSVESQLAADQESVHFVVRGEKTDNIYQMVKVDKKSGKVELHDIATYKNDEQVLYDSMPFSFKKSFFSYQKHLYFIDGFGKVYQINSQTGKSKPAFTLSQEKMKADFKEIHRKGDKLYFFTYSYNKPANIEQYSLKTGKKLNDKEIEDVKKVVTPKSHLKLYDFQVLKGF